MAIGTTASLVIMGIAIAASAAASMAAAKAQADAQRFQAKVAERQAERERDIAARKAEDKRRETSHLIAAQRGALAGSGIDTGSGTALLLTEDTAREGKLGELDILVGGEARASDLAAAAELRRTQASNTETAGQIKAGTTLLTGAAGIASGGFGQTSLGTSFPTVPATQTGPGGRLAGPV